MKLSLTLSYGFIAALTLTAMNANAQTEYKQAPVPISTVWGENMTPETAWPNHPRPNLERANWANLNGLWDYAITTANAKAQPETWEGKVLVPFAMESSLSGVGRSIEPNEAIWYRRSFNVEDLGGQRLLLHFDGIDFRSQVFVNGIEVTDIPHESGILPQTLDITEAVKIGNNELVVYAWDPTNTWQVASGKQYVNPHGIWYTRVSGIWQTVWTEIVPETYITSYEVYPDINNETAFVKINTSGNLMGAKAKIVVKDANNKKVASGKVKNWDEPVALKIAEAQLWSPENPYLYNMEITLDSKSGTDEVKGYFGLRSIEMRKDKNGIQSFYLNNKKIYMLGTLDQGWWPDGLLTPPSDEAMEFDIRFLKEAGFNMMRKHIKVEPMRYYYLCDKLGILVWQDMPSGAGDVNQRYGMYRRELKGMVDYLQAIPSIVMWVPYNEGWGEQDAFMVNSTLTWLMNYDKTRLVDGPSGWTDHGVGHAKDMHNYPGPGMFDLMQDRISVLGEFGGLGLAIKEHLWQDKGSWGYVSDTETKDSFDRYVSLMNRLSFLASRGLGASVYTQTTDVEIEINGLLTYDRKVDKYGRENLRAIHQKVYDSVDKYYEEIALIKPEENWKYTIEAPANGWEQPQFDDSKWKTGKAGFGNQVIKKDSQNAHVNTSWETPNIWLRKSFEWDGIGTFDLAFLNIYFDENPVIYLNGQEIAQFKDWNGNYDPKYIVDIQAFQKALKKGTNVLAVSCQNAQGGAYIDLGLYILKESK